MFRGVRRKRTRQTCKFGRTVCEQTNAGGNDQAACNDSLTRFEDKLKAVCHGLDAGNLPLIEVGQSLALIPVSVAHEVVEGYGAGKMSAACGFGLLHGQRLVLRRSYACVP